MMSVSEEIDVRSAARFAGRSAETIRRWVWSGRLPARKQGNRLLVQRRDLEAVLGQQGGVHPSLAVWAELAEAALRRHPGPYHSAADLVLEERRAGSRR